MKQNILTIKNLCWWKASQIESLNIGYWTFKIKTYLLQKYLRFAKVSEKITTLQTPTETIIIDSLMKS